MFTWGGGRIWEDMCYERRRAEACVCVFITAGPSTKMFTWGGGGYGRTCATRDDEPRPVCVFITAVPNTKLFAWGEEDSGGHVL
jgi:hypothetical protein